MIDTTSRRKRAACFLALLVLTSAWSVFRAAAADGTVQPSDISAPAASRPPQPPATHAEAFSLIDAASGRILHSANGDRRMRIASLTKIMTAIVAIEHGRLEDIVTVSPRAAFKEGSSIYLRAGDKVPLETLLYGLMLRSGNDAATAIAEHVGGSEEGFVFLMNRKAEEIGLSDTRFANPHGLDQAGHYSTANDLARLTAYAMRNPVFRKIAATKVKTFPNPNGGWDYHFLNKNKMLFRYEGADGVKTGYTRLARRCLVSSATRNGQQLIAVTLNDGNDWEDHRRLLDYGFAAFPLEEVIAKGQRMEGLPYEAAAPFRYPFAAGEREKLRALFQPFPPDSLEYRFGLRGRLTFELDGRVIGSVPLRDTADRARPD
ncbi:MAG TPA: D-alanyl-D-alanine carboxypeptidase family protein [Paenibacillaceae bacterium]